MPGISRRAFLGSLPLATLALEPPTLLREFGYQDVTLTSSLHNAQLEQTHSTLMAMSEDSLLRPFRLRQGLPAPGEELGGWYNTYGFAPACTFGQWISALSRYYAITGDPDTQAKVQRLLSGYAATIEPFGKFYVENRFPSYVYDKLVLACIDAHTFALDASALATLRRTTEAAAKYLPPTAVPRRETPVLHNEDMTEHCWDESYTLPENLFLAYERSGDAHYLPLAKRFLMDQQLWNPLAQGENVLPGKHAYSHVNALASAAKAYLTLGDAKYLRAAQNGFSFVQQQSYATGGWGPDEHFFTPGTGKLADSLTSTHANFETPCGAYAHFKITRYLLRLTRDSRHGDSMEQVMYNTVLGVKPMEADGQAFYYSDYNRAGTKTFHPDRWPCCSGTLPQVAADYRINTYFRDPQGIYVNLYIPSTLRWRHGSARLELTQKSNYPLDGFLRFTLAASQPTVFSLRLRIPGWAGEGALLRVNQKRVPVAIVPGHFAVIQRTWQTGDIVELELPLPLRLQPVDAQHPNQIALLKGPLVLFGVNADAAQLTSRQLLAARPTASAAAEWTAETSGTSLRLLPFTAIRNETYTTYFAVA